MTDPANDVEFFYLRPRDIAVYVGEGTLDIGLTGRDLVLDSRAPVDGAAHLGFGESTFHFAAPEGRFAVRGPRRRARRDVVRRCARGLLQGARDQRAGRSGWTVRSSPRSGSVSPTRSPTWSRPGTRSSRPGWRSSVTRS